MRMNMIGDLALPIVGQLNILPTYINTIQEFLCMSEILIEFLTLLLLLCHSLFIISFGQSYIELKKTQSSVEFFIIF